MLRLRQMLAETVVHFCFFLLDKNVVFVRINIRLFVDIILLS